MTTLISEICLIPVYATNVVRTIICQGGKVVRTVSDFFNRNCTDIDLVT